MHTLYPSKSLSQNQPEYQMKKALVLSGGSVRGAFQVGAVAEVLKTFQPDYIYGVSVGALNGAFLTDAAAKPQFQSGTTLRWKEIGEALIEFWMKNVTQPSDLVKERSLVNILVSEVFTKNFNGLTSTKPLIDLLKRTLDINRMRASPVLLKTGYTDIETGIYADGEPQQPDFIGYLLASAHLPIIMPLIEVKGRWLTDGGLVHVSPLESALKDRNTRDITEIVCISCQADRLPTNIFKTGSLLTMIEWSMEIMNREIVNNDLRTMGDVNTQIASGTRITPAGKTEREIAITNIRPLNDVPIDIRTFTSAQIAELIQNGRDAAQKVMPNHKIIFNNNLPMFAGIIEE